jgi:hypothetical protein
MITLLLCDFFVPQHVIRVKDRFATSDNRTNNDGIKTQTTPEHDDLHLYNHFLVSQRFFPRIVTMWRLACSSVRRRVLSRCSSGGRSNLAAGSLTWFSRAASAVDTDDWKHTAHHAFIKSTPIRHFSRRPKDHLDDPQEEMLEERESQAKKENEESVAAVWNMEFFDEQLINANSDDAGYNDGDDDEEELAARMDEEYRQKQEEIQRELDSREGRPWKDPWAIKEEQWMSTTGFDDLPDWSSDRVSRISQERVQVLPGKLWLYLL